MADYAFEIAGARVGNWDICLHEVHHGDQTSLSLSLDSPYVDLDIPVASAKALRTIADDIETSEERGVDLTDANRCHAGTTELGLYVFTHERVALWFLLLSHHDPDVRFCARVPIDQTDDLIQALRETADSAE